MSEREFKIWMAVGMALMVIVVFVGSLAIYGQHEYFKAEKKSWAEMKRWQEAYYRSHPVVKEVPPKNPFYTILRSEMTEKNGKVTNRIVLESPTPPDFKGVECVVKGSEITWPAPAQKPPKASKPVIPGIAYEPILTDPLDGKPCNVNFNWTLPISCLDYMRLTDRHPCGQTQTCSEKELDEARAEVEKMRHYPISAQKPKASKRHNYAIVGDNLEQSCEHTPTMDRCEYRIVCRDRATGELTENQGCSHPITQPLPEKEQTPDWLIKLEPCEGGIYRFHQNRMTCEQEEQTPEQWLKEQPFNNITCTSRIGIPPHCAPVEQPQ